MKGCKRVFALLCVPFFASALATISFANGNVEDDAAEFFAADVKASLESTDENTSGGAISVPETPRLSPEETSPAFPISGTSETIYTSEKTARTDIVDVSLPNDLPFDIVIFSGTGNGVVASSDFLITNNGAFAVNVSVCDAHVTVANEDAFSVRSDKNLPEEGNNIYIDMIRDSGATSSSGILGTRPNGENFGFALESGASGAFRFEGAVNEHGDMKWEDTTVTISLRFEITIPGAEAVFVPETAAISEDPAVLEEPAVSEIAEEETKEDAEEPVREGMEETSMDETPAEGIETTADGEEDADSGPTDADGAPSEEGNGSLPSDDEPIDPDTVDPNTIDADPPSEQTGTSDDRSSDPDETTPPDDENDI